jgi:lipoprotein-anchoring transpeptidase ErfK/SrfK
LRVTIDLSEQTAYFYRGNKKVGRSRVATGLPGHSTPRGSFTIIEKKADKRSNLYGVLLDSNGNVVKGDADSRQHAAPAGGRFRGASMPYWMRLTRGGVGMHMGPIPNPGRPASHGCIRMPREIAETLFDKAPLGTPVKIVD